MTLKSRPHRTEHRERERSRPAEWILFTPIILKALAEILNRPEEFEDNTEVSKQLSWVKMSKGGCEPLFQRNPS